MKFKIFLKTISSYIISFIVNILIYFFQIIKCDFVLEIIFEKLNIIKKNIKRKDKNFKFYVKNNLLRYRVDSFFTKEPQTIKWIETFKENSNFWDIGSNIGLYSIYAAKTKNSNVISFEPSYYNLETLVSNILLNKLSSKIAVVPSWLIEEKGSIFIDYKANISGSANLSISSNDSLNTIKSYGLSLDLFKDLYDVEYPNYIKIDVDGSELNLLKGSQNIIKKVDEILIEVENKNKNIEKINEFFLNKNFIKISEESSKINTTEKSPVNQIWKNEHKYL